MLVGFITNPLLTQHNHIAKNQPLTSHSLHIEQTTMFKCRAMLGSFLSLALLIVTTVKAWKHPFELEDKINSTHFG